ncbi:hypothetical protein M0R89_20515 (plasmid) [Halorussus limi]|uniref:Uncharacterized protein n=1 Tax=Halorussus limi TaxID=2938695 RepID=A0A8U0I2G0_9EURY|nr:hypothetical protein [Halorussus limi]UPV76854.1 hypothetical protein M0R89_20515 [Halorussus limi]
MSTRLGRAFSDLRIDTTMAGLGVLVASLLFPLRFFASQIYIETIPVVLGVACLLYLAGVRTETRDDHALPRLPARVSAFLPSVVFLGAAALVVVAVRAGERSLLFYDIAGVLGTLVVGQALFVGDEEFDRNWLLAQVVVLAAAIRLPALYVNPGFIGIDLWTHVPRLADAILTEGTLDAIDDNKHYAAPFYHLYVVASSLLYGSSLRIALHLSLGLVVPLASLFVYATANLFTGERWAVLAAALYAVADYPIEWGIHVIPTSQGLFMFLGVAYMVVRLMRIENRLRDFLLLSVVSVAIILTHQVSTFIMLVLLGSTLAARLLVEYGPFAGSASVFNPFDGEKTVRILGLLVFDAGFTLFMWSFTPYAGADQPFLSLVLSYLMETLASSAGFLNLVGGASRSSGGGAASAAPTLVEQVALYVDTTGFLLFMLLTFVGCLYVVHRKRASQATFTLLVSTAVMLVFVLGLPMFGIDNFVPQRWIAFMYAPMAVLGVVGLRYLSRSLDSRLFVALAVVLALAFPSVMVMSSNGTVDDPVFPGERERLSYTEQELAAVDTIGAMTGSPDRDELTGRQILHTDHPYQTVFTRTRSYPAAPAVVNESRPVTHDLVVYREYQRRGASFFLTGENGSGKIRDIPQSRLCRPTMGEVYANGDVTMCSTP